jgi:ESS family glutamate:Na+ symporter
MQTGVTAMGLLLLRLVDPMYKTKTATAFGFKQMIYEPFLGGGLITAMGPFIIVGLGAWGAIGIAAGIMVVFVVVSALSGWTRVHPTLKHEGE